MTADAVTGLRRIRMTSRKVIKSAFESMLFVWGQPLPAKDAAEIFDISEQEAIGCFEELQAEYEQEGRGIRIRRVGKSFQFVTHGENETFVRRLCTPVKIKKLSQATGMWKHVPVIVVITKSYSEPDREKNIQMVEQALAKDKRLREVVKAIVPVVAENYVINAQAFAPVDGVSQLIELTNRYMPEGISESEKDIAEYIRKRKGYFAHGIVVAATGVAAGLGFAPLPFSDALVLSPTEFAEIRALAQLYGISDDDDSKQMIDTIVNVGTVGVAAKAAISAIKAIPGINIAAGVLNAIIAGSFAFAIGEGSAYIFEQIYLGNKSTNDIDWVKKVINEELANGFVEKVAKVVTVASEMDNKSDWLKLIPGLINDVFYAQKKAAPASEAPTA